MSITCRQLSDSERSLIGQCSLYSDFSEPDLDFALRFFGAERGVFSPGEYLLKEGDSLSFFGLVLSGKIRVSMTAITGEELLMAGVLPGGTFAESLCYLSSGRSGISIRADENSTVLLMTTEHLRNSLLSPERPQTTGMRADDLNAARLSRVLTDRFLRMLATRTLTMNRRIQTLTRTTLRRKLIAYFSECREDFGSDTFSIPLDREGLASYLGTDRSALSRELSAMQKEGLISYQKNEFRLNHLS